MSTIQEISVDGIRPSPHNPRIFRDKDPELVSLAESIAALGVLSPVLVRPVQPVNEGPAYELIAGERRWRAARMARRATLPAIVREDLTEHQALELTVTENLQRENLHPLEEAAGVAALLGDGHDYRAVADRLGKSLGWVARRARLAKLTPTWRKLIAKADSPVSRWSAEALELVARLEPAAQDAFEKEHRNAIQHRHLGLADLRRSLADYTHELRLAPWKVDDDTLDPKAGACTTCPKRSSCTPGLFDDVETDGKKAAAGDRCLDAVCWAGKHERRLARVADELKAEHGKVLFAGGGYYGEKLPAFVGKAQLVNSWDGQSAKKGDAGAVAVLHVTGRDAGKVEFRVYGKEASSKAAKAARGGKPAVMSLAERRKKLAARRQAHSLEALCAAVEKAPTPKTDELLALAAAFGTEHTHDRPGAYSHGKEIKLHAALSKPDAVGRLWKSVAEVIARRWRKTLDWRGQKGLAEIQPEIAEVVRRIDLDVSPFEAAAAEAIPEPKGWARLAELERAGKKQAKPKKSKAKAA